MGWRWVYLGCLDYCEALRLQDLWARQIAQGAGPLLLLLEHPPTVTLGRQARRENLRLGPEGYHARGIALVEVARGGDVTAHGPGQLVGYPIASLPRLKVSVPEWVRGHAEALQRVLARRGIDARWSDLHPGLWIGKRKLAAFGFQISRGVSRHGFALNVNNDLALFDTIVPCGLHRLGVTSLAREGVPIDGASLAGEVAWEVAARFGATPPLAMDREEVLSLLAPDTPDRQAFGGEGS